MSTPDARTRPSRPGEPIAIVGLGCIMPDAPNVPQFWDNILQARVSIREVPPERWPQSVHWSADRSAPDRTYSKIGAFVTEMDFDPLEFRIPPKVAESMDDVQKMALVATREALADAGLLDRTPLGKHPGSADRSRWGVILGNSMGGEVLKYTDRRMALREALAAFEGDTVMEPASKERALALLRSEMDQLPPITEDSMPGELSNVISGRICQVFDISGKNHTVDAACASSLAAMDAAVKALHAGELDVAITGGADRSMDPGTYAKFSKIGALSAEGSFPFDERASGFVMGEGAGVIVLKRLSDARRDGDRVYAVISGIGSASDGKGKGITAPNPSGQEKAVRHALADAGWRPSELGLIEAHGTSTPVGDPVELKVLAGVFTGLPPATVAVGSIKSQIGHLKSAAGAAAMIKAALAVHHGIIPPSAGFERPNPKVPWDRVPFYVPTRPQPWAAPVRRAGVSAFGFGGTNFHILIEEPPKAAAFAPPAGAAPAGYRVVVLSADTRDGLAAKAVAFAKDVKAGIWDDAAASDQRASGRVRLAMVIDTRKPDDTLEALGQALMGKLAPELAARKGIFVGQGEPGKVAFVFPGQGSQYAGMLLDLADAFPVVSRTLQDADRVLEPLLGKPLTWLLRVNEGESADAVEERLKATEVCQPAVLACDVAISRLLAEFGVEPDMVAGHSLGEYAALVVGGALSFEDALVAVSARGKEMAHVDIADKGTMAFVPAPPDKVQPILAQCSDYVITANINSPRQTIIAGSTPGVAEAMERLSAAGFECRRIPVSAAFHTSIVAPASAPLKRVLDRLDVKSPGRPVYSNVTASRYPREPEAIREMLAKQVAAPVRWIDEIEAMYGAGARVFVEVGPKRVLQGLVSEILAGRPHAALATNHPKGGALFNLYGGLAALAAQGVPVRLPVPRTDRAAPGARATDATSAAPRAVARPRLVVTGAAIGLPGADRNVFDDGNVDALLAGENRIGPVPRDQRERMVAKGIRRLVKGPGGGEAHFESIDSTDQVIKLAGRPGHIALEDYGFDDPWLKSLDVTSKLALAAGLEALRDAYIPLVREAKTATTGKVLHGAWVLPAPLQDETGIIFASAFPGYDNLVRIIEGQGVGPAPSGAGQDALVRFLADLIPRLKDRESREEALRLLTQLGSPPSPTAAASASEWPTTGFPRDFLFRVLSLGHAELAQLIRARGPNVQVNTACASTTTALSIAEDWIQAGRCKRVIIVAADDVTSEHLFEWIGAGFLAAGAATTEARVEDAALPFDRRRHGMIVGMGACALVLETDDLARERGVEPIAELLGTVTANSAYHGSRLDVEHIAGVLERFVSAVEAAHGLDRKAIANDLVFVSHETYTPARGGSAQAEVDALRRVFGDKAKDILIANTKGFTGHPMGAGIEDALAVKILEKRRVPPVANLREPDPALGPLNLSRGGPCNNEYVLRLAAGFGSQVGFMLLRRASPTPRALNADVHARWLARVTGMPGARTAVDKRVLRVVSVVSAGADLAVPAAAHPGISRVLAPLVTPSMPAARPVPAPLTGPVPSAGPRPALQPPVNGQDDILRVLTQVIAEKTGYPVDVLDPDLDLEADLGIDTVKQAELFGEARDRFDVPREEGLSIADYPTLRKIAGYFGSRMPGAAATPAPALMPISSTSSAPTSAGPPAAPPRPAAPVATSDGDDEVLTLITRLIAAKTGYPVDVLDPDLDLEADLGIDTVKQAELFGEAREKFGVPREEGLSIADYPTLRKIAQYFALRRTGAAPAPAAPVQGAATAPQVRSAPKAATLGSPSGPSHVGAGPAEPAAVLAPAPAGAEVRGPPARTAAVARYELLLADAPAAPVAPLEGHTFSLVGEPELVERISAVLQARGAHTRGAPATTLVDLSLLSLRRPPADAAEFEDQRRTFLDLVRRLRADPALLGQGREVVIVTGLGGHLGVHPHSSTGLHGAALGFAKALAREVRARVRAIDVDATQPRLADAIADELARERTPTEVGLFGDHRVVIDLQPVAAGPAAEPMARIRDGAVVLATGGLGAVASAVLARLARQTSVRIAILGRTPVTGAPDLDPDDASAVTALRNRLLTEGRASGGKVRPAEIEARVQHAVKSARQAAALRALAAVADVRYEVCDVSDLAQLRATVERITTQWARPSVVLHAAGLERSKEFLAKSEAEWEEVFDVKTRGAFNLLQTVGPEARYLFFGSVAGRFGNAGQTDYAAANDALAKLARRLPNAVLVHWTAWEGPGMAASGSIRKLLEERGIEFLAPEEGAEFAVNELLSGMRGEVVVAGKLSAFDHPDTSLLGTVERAEGVLEAPVALDAQRPLLAHHAIGGTPVFPAVGGLACFARLSALSGMSEVEFRSVRFGKALRIPKAATLEAHATLDVRGPPLARLVSRRGGEETLHFTAALRPPTPLGVEAAAPDVRGAELSAEKLYTRLFHGPAFRVLGEVRLVEGGSEARYALPADEPGLPLWALALEAAMQAAGAWEAFGNGRAVLPAAIERATFDPARVTRDGTIRATLTATDAQGSTWTVHAWNDVGGPCLVVEGLRLVSLTPAFGPDDALGSLAGRFGMRVVTVPVAPAADASPNSKRQAETQAGLKAAQRLASALGHPEAHLVKDDLRAPSLHTLTGELLPVTIAHAGAWACAAHHPKGRAGADIERIEPRSDAWEREAFTEGERKVLDAASRTLHLPRAAVLTGAWCIKEAYLKAMGTGLRMDLHSVRVERLEKDTAYVTTTLGGKHEVGWAVAGEYAMALCGPVA